MSSLLMGDEKPRNLRLLSVGLRYGIAAQIDEIIIIIGRSYLQCAGKRESIIDQPFCKYLIFLNQSAIYLESVY